MAKRNPQQSLRDWTKQEWMTSETYKNKKKGSSKEVKSEGKKRYLPKAAWSALSESEKKATNLAKSKGNKAGKQFVSQPKSIAKKVSKYRPVKKGRLGMDMDPENPITTNRKVKARAIRTSSRTNEKGETETHRMQMSEGAVGKKTKHKYIVNPTIFPDKDGSWKDFGSSPIGAFKEASKRGELFAFKNKNRAEKFSFGSWKKGRDRREAMKEYRKYKKESKSSEMKKGGLMKKKMSMGGQMSSASLPTMLASKGLGSPLLGTKKKKTNTNGKANKRKSK